MSGVSGPYGGRSGFRLGNFRTIEEAKQKCEEHYADSSDVSAAKASR
jgi:hypothetical protein